MIENNITPRKWLIELRKAKSLTQLELARTVGVANSAINKYELGLRRPTIKIAVKLADVLGFDWHRFFEDELASAVITDTAST
jgi:transcriptional regulator with XRE-family HTH domain